MRIVDHVLYFGNKSYLLKTWVGCGRVGMEPNQNKRNHKCHRVLKNKINKKYKKCLYPLVRWWYKNLIWTMGIPWWKEKMKYFQTNKLFLVGCYSRFLLLSYVFCISFYFIYPFMTSVKSLEVMVLIFFCVSVCVCFHLLVCFIY